MEGCEDFLSLLGPLDGVDDFLCFGPHTEHKPPTSELSTQSKGALGRAASADSGSPATSVLQARDCGH